MKKFGWALILLVVGWTRVGAVQIDPAALEVAYTAVKQGLCAADITCALPDDMLIPYLPTPGPDEFWRTFYTRGGEVILSSWYSKPLEVPLEALRRMYRATGRIPLVTIVYPVGERDTFWRALEWVRREPVCRQIRLVESGQTEKTVYAQLGAEWVPLVIYRDGILVGWELGGTNGWLIPVGPTLRFWIDVARRVADLADMGKRNEAATEDPVEKFEDPNAQPHPEAVVVPKETFCLPKEETP